MASSGTYGFTMSRDDIIGAALRLTGAFGDQDVIPPLTITNCAQALNVVAKSLVTKGLPLWCVVDLPVPMIAGQTSYNLSIASGQPNPLRILDLYIRDSQNNDVTLQNVSRYDYNTLGQKFSPGIPNQAFYDPQIGASLLTVYNTPVDSTRTLHVVYQRQIQDFNLAVDTPDFPQEAYRLLKWALADEISLEFQTPGDIRLEIGLKCKMFTDEFFDMQQEQTSVYFTPSERSR